MNDLSGRKKTLLPLACGIMGCILMASGDWLMIYGDTAYEGRLAWLTLGAAGVSPWRNAVSMAVAFPAIILYAVALISVGRFIKAKQHRRRYNMLTTVGMTPWLCLHLFYVMILFLFSWLNARGEGAMALASCEALFDQFSWLVIVSDILMLTPFVYLFWQIAAGKTTLPRWSAVNNPLVLFVIMKVIVRLLPDVPARLAFLNGLMSECMAVWFCLLILLTLRSAKGNVSA